MKIKPKILNPKNVVKLFKSEGSKTITLEKLQADIDAGDFVTPDGKINILEYLAWLIKNNK